MVYTIFLPPLQLPTSSKNKNELFPSKGLLYPTCSISCCKNTRYHRGSTTMPTQSEGTTVFWPSVLGLCVFIVLLEEDYLFFFFFSVQGFFFSLLCSLNKCSAMNKVNIAVSLSAYFSVCFIIWDFFKRNVTHSLGWFPAALKVHWHFS